MAHVPWRDELALLHVDRAPGICGGHQQIGLAAEERRNLQHDLYRSKGIAHSRALFGGMDVRQDRQSIGFTDSPQNAAALCKPRPTKAVDRGAIGLVVAGFEDVRHAEVRGDALNGISHAACVALGLYDTGPGNKK